MKVERYDFDCQGDQFHCGMKKVESDGYVELEDYFALLDVSMKLRSPIVVAAMADPERWVGKKLIAEAIAAFDKQVSES